MTDLEIKHSVVGKLYRLRCIEEAANKWKLRVAKHHVITHWGAPGSMHKPVPNGPKLEYGETVFVTAKAPHSTQVIVRELILWIDNYEWVGCVEVTDE